MAGMTNEQFNAHLELLAKLIERTASSVEEAAALVRESKVEIGKAETKKSASFLSFDVEDLAVPEIHVNKNSGGDE